MKNKNASMPFEAVLQNGELSHLHEVVQFLERTENDNLFPDKYNAALRLLVSQQLETLYIEDANMPIKKVISTVLERLSDALSAEILLKITAFSIEKWKELTASKQLQTV